MVKRKMPDPISWRLIIVAATLLFSLSAWAAGQSSVQSNNKEWITKQQIDGGTLVLHWTHVYEGKDTVFRIDFPKRKDAPNSMEVEGQPIINPTKTFIVFPYCADDGCNAEVTILDLINHKKLSTIKLPYKGQFYIKVNWHENLLNLEVEYFSDSGIGVVKHLFEVTRNGVVEKRNLTLRSSGLAVLRQIRSVDLKQPVIVLTGDTSPEREQEVRALGVSEFIIKGSSLQFLEDTLKRLLHPSVVRQNG